MINGGRPPVRTIWTWYEILPSLFMWAQVQPAAASYEDPSQAPLSPIWSPLLTPTRDSDDEVIFKKTLA